MLTSAVAATLAEVLGDGFDEQQVAAWTALIGVLHSIVDAVYGDGALATLRPR